MDAKIQAAKKIEMAKEDIPMEPSKETLNYDKNNPKPKAELKEDNSKPVVK